MELIRFMRFEVNKMEQRLIDANKIKYRTVGAGGWNQPENVVSDYEIEKMPTVDAVEVVRCKDCIHWYEPEGVCLKIYSDGNVSPYAWQDRKPDDFCSYGKKEI